MAKSRLKSKFLNDHSSYHNLRPTSHRATLVWQWLQHVKPGTDDTGVALRVMRGRIDMPNRFPHRTYLLNYMLKCKIPPALASRVLIHVWNMYALYRDAVLHEGQLNDGNVVESTQEYPS